MAGGTVAEHNGYDTDGTSVESSAAPGPAVRPFTPRRRSRRCHLKRTVPPAADRWRPGSGVSGGAGDGGGDHGEIESWSAFLPQRVAVVPVLDLLEQSAHCPNTSPSGPSARRRSRRGTRAAAPGHPAGQRQDWFEQRRVVSTCEGGDQVQRDSATVAGHRPFHALPGRPGCARRSRRRTAPVIAPSTARSSRYSKRPPAGGTAPRRLNDRIGKVC
jgi:hypothetical protein